MPLSQLATSMNLAEAMNSVMPVVNVFASTHDAARLYQALCDGGAPALEADTLAEALKPAGPLVVDDLLPLPVRFSAGFKLGEPTVSVFGLNTPRAFGHLCFMNQVCWADPARSLSVAFVNTGKPPSPEGSAGMAAVTNAICLAVPPRR